MPRRFDSSCRTSLTVADVIIAETGAQMDAFPTAAHLASWTGVCPGQNESAGRIKSTHTRPGNRYLKGALGVAALSAFRSKTCYLAAKYRRIRNRTGNLKAVVAIQDTFIVIIWNMLTNGVAYEELGPDYYDRRNSDHLKNKAIRQLQNLGLDVRITPSTA
jgi:transposase